MTEPFLPFALPSIGEEEIAEVADSMRSGWLTTGPKVKQFEKLFSDFIGSSHAMAVNSATAGLHLAMEAIGVGPGDKVITTPYTFTATAEVVRYLGADPVFVDIDQKTFNINPEKIVLALKSQPDVKAIMPVHFAGQACDMAAVLELAEEYDIRVVEDAAHALPATCQGQLLGSIGDLGVFSFYATKTITTGEGGMVVTDNPDIAARIKKMRLHGIDRDVFGRYSTDKPSWYYEVVAPGYKYNMTDIAASIGIHQLKKAEIFHGKRRMIAEEYNSAFADLPVSIPHVAHSSDLHSWHLYVIQLKLEELSIDRDQFIDLMAGAGIGTSVHFIPLHLQPYWRDRYQLAPEDFPVALDVFQRAVSLPIYPKMTNDDIGRVVSTVRSLLIRYAK